MIFMAYINNETSNTLVSGTSSADSIQNSGSNVSQSAAARTMIIFFKNAAKMLQ